MWQQSDLRYREKGQFYADILPNQRTKTYVEQQKSAGEFAPQLSTLPGD